MAERDLEDYEDDADDEEDEFDCHAMFSRSGKFIGCGAAGSEECDFQCPYRSELYGEEDDE